MSEMGVCITLGVVDGGDANGDNDGEGGDDASPTDAWKKKQSN